MDRLDGNNIVPLYEQLKNEIKSKIDKQLIREGEKLPSETDLCRLYGVSRITVRRAVNDLVEEQILERRQGKGTFVVYKPMPLAVMGMNGVGFSDKLRSRRKSIVVSKMECSASQNESQMLRIQKNDPLYVFVRKIMLDGKPWMIDKCVYPAERYPGFLDKVEDNVSTYDILRKEYGAVISGASKEIAVTYATHEQANVLECQVGKPLFRVLKIVYDDQNKPIHISTTYSDADKVVFVTDGRIERVLSE